MTRTEVPHKIRSVTSALMQLIAAVSGSPHPRNDIITAVTKPTSEGMNEPVAPRIAGNVRAASVT